MYMNRLGRVIVETLTKEGPLRSNSLTEIVIGKKNTKGKVDTTKPTFYKKLKSLIEEGKIIRDPQSWEVKTNVWYCVPADFSRMMEKKGEKGKRGALHILEDKIIKPWIAQLPEISCKGIYHPKTRALRKRERFRDENAVLPVETDVLFDSLRPHVNPGCGNPYEMLDEFKEQAEIFWAIRDDGWNKTMRIIENAIANKVENYVMQTNFVEYVYEGAIQLAKGQKKAFNASMDSQHPSFNVTQHEDEYHFNYGIDPFVVQKGKGKGREKELEKRMRECIRDIKKEVEKDEYVDKIKEIVYLTENLKQQKKELKASVEKLRLWHR